MTAVAALSLAGVSPARGQQSASAAALFDRAQALERSLEVAKSHADAGGKPVPVASYRRASTAYETVVRRYPRSGYCDDALWSGSQIAIQAARRSGEARDRNTAVRLLRWLVREYPHSRLVPNAKSQLARIDDATRKAPARASPPPTKAVPADPVKDVAVTPPPAAKPAIPTPPAPAPPAVDQAVPPPAKPTRAEEKPAPPPVSLPPAAEKAPPAPPPPAEGGAAGSAAAASLRGFRRIVMQEVVRVVLETDHEVAFTTERAESPPRLSVDLLNTAPSPDLLEGTLSYDDAVVRRITVGRLPPRTTRIVLDLEGVTRHSIFTLTGPFRIVIDCERATATRAARQPATRPAQAPERRPVPSIPVPVLMADLRGDPPAPAVVSAPPPPPSPPTKPAEAAGRPAAAASAGEASPPPTTPRANESGRFSMARQLGLGISRVVIDPGHGGHDPGATGAGLTEAAIVLDVALRLEQLLLKEPGVEVTLTRRRDEYVALESRTVIANQAGADLFLSIHANASRNHQARGVETYFLNFASTPDAEAVAARENASSGRTMSNLPDIIKAIALNSKIDESRDFAGEVQAALVRRLRPSNRTIRDLGVKQAPFVVLIGATMPSVLVEIAFITHGQEGRLLRSAAYRQRIAEALLEGIRRYQTSLKGVRVVTNQ